MSQVREEVYRVILEEKIEVAKTTVESMRQLAIKAGNKKRAAEWFEAGRLLRKYEWNLEHGIRLNQEQQYFIHKCYILSITE